MSQNTPLTRRDVLKASALLGGGLILGLTLPGRATAATLGQAGGQPVAWLRIAADNTITVLVDRSEMGQGVYTAMTQLIAEELEVEPASVCVAAAPVGDAYINALLGGQLTGGSTSVRDAWEKLRRAGAQARTMLQQAAADHWGVPVGSVYANGGAILDGRGNRLTYGELAEAAARLPVPKDVPLKPAAAFKLVGKAHKRVDTGIKVDGSAVYGIDVKLPGMLHASIEQPPALGAKLSGFDASVAEKMPGVRKVVATRSGVAVIADHYWQAYKARSTLKVQWDRGPNANLDTAGIHTLLKTAAAKPGKVVRRDGDAPAALAAAKRVVRAEYRLPLLAHATLEPQTCTADVRADHCEVYAPTQFQPAAQAVAAEAAGLAPAQVTIHTTYLGGGFGRRLEVDFVPAAVECSKAVGRPVKVIWSREDDFAHDTYRPAFHQQLAAGFDASGKLSAWHFHITAPSVTARMFPPVVAAMVDPFAVEAAANYPYDVANVHVDYLPQEIGIDVGYNRCVSHAPNCFAAESFMDELAAAAGQDPYQFRRGLLDKQPRFRAVLDEAAQRSGWGKAAKGRHQGIALMEGYGSYLALVAEISVDKGALRIHRLTCAVDCGQMVNPNIVDQQVSGGIIYGLTSALWGEITLTGGAVQQKNFGDHRLLRLNETPAIDVHLLPSNEAPGGIGEPSVALVAPALCNAIHAATRRRIRALPLSSQKVVKV
ncbi:MAG: molybdopterin cofactor-binding domain-containing protein [Gammaproteobacteria bacterium]